MKNKITALLLSAGLLFSAQSNWWEQFGDSTLNAIVQQGLSENQNLQAARKKSDQALEQSKVVRSQLLPSVYANGRWNGVDMEPLDDMRQTASISFDGRYNLSAWGEELQQYRAMKRLYEAQAQDVRHSELQSATQISKLYFDAIYTKKQLAILEKQRENAQVLLDITRKRYNEGLSTGLALLQQKQQLASVEASIPAAEMQYQNAISYLSATVFVPETKLESQLPEALPMVESYNWSSSSVEKRADLEAVRLREEAAKASFNKATLTVFPDITLTGSRGWDMMDPQTASVPGGPADGEWQTMWSVGAQISVPLFTGGAVLAGYKDGKNGYEAAQAQRIQRESDAQAELKNAIASESAYMVQVKAYTTQLEASKAVYNESLRQYRNGLVEYHQVLTSVTALQQSEIAYLQSTRNLLHARLSVIQALGGSLPDQN